MVLTAINQSQAIGVAGQPIGLTRRTRSYINNRADVAKVVDYAITAQNSTAYTITIDGIAVSITSDGSATVAEVRDALVAAVIANTFANAKVVATASGNNVRITERAPSNGEITLTVTSNLAATMVTAHGETEPMPPGIAVAQGPGDQDCRLMSSGAAIVGVTVYSPARAGSFGNQALADDGRYAPNSLVPVMHDGEMIVEVEEAVTPASAVYVRHAANGANTQLGAFRGSSDSSTATAVTAFRYLSSADAGGLAQVGLKLP